MQLVQNLHKLQIHSVIGNDERRKLEEDVGISQ
jgi:hypothetical protein